MITLTGIFRQSGEMNLGKEGEEKRPFVKVWMEVESPRENGVADLSIEEILVPAENAKKLPKKGENISVDVRCYARGRDVAFSGLSVRSAALYPESPQKALEGALAGK
jgi:hypothetical protein